MGGKQQLKQTSASTNVISVSARKEETIHVAHNMRGLDLVRTTLKIELKLVGSIEPTNLRFDGTQLTSTRGINETPNKIRFFF